MSIIKVQCPNCGGVLQVNDSNEASLCKYCGTPFVTEKAMVVVEKSKDISEQIKKVKRLIDAEMFDEARKVRDEALIEHPDNYRSWLLTVLIESRNYKIYDSFDGCKEIVKNIQKLMSLEGGVEPEFDAWLERFEKIESDRQQSILTNKLYEMKKREEEVYCLNLCNKIPPRKVLEIVEYDFNKTYQDYRVKTNRQGIRYQVIEEHTLENWIYLTKSSVYEMKFRYDNDELIFCIEYSSSYEYRSNSFKREYRICTGHVLQKKVGLLVEEAKVERRKKGLYGCCGFCGGIKGMLSCNCECKFTRDIHSINKPLIGFYGNSTHIQWIVSCK